MDIDAVKASWQKAATMLLNTWEGLHTAVVDFGLGDSATRELPHDKVVADNVPIDEGANAMGSYIVGTGSIKDTVTKEWNDLRKSLGLEPTEPKYALDKTTGKHRVLLDLDCPHVYVPSTNPGHGHLVIDVAQDWETYKKLLQLLGDMGILQYGYVDASFRRGETWLRAPGVQKYNSPNAGGPGL